MHRPLPCKYSRASRDAARNLKIALDVHIQQLGDPRAAELRAEFEAMADRIYALDNELQEECNAVTKHPDYDQMRTGAIPYPMEPLGAFKPQCNCQVTCNVCSGLYPRYLDPDGDCAGVVRHTCADECPIHGYSGEGAS